MAPIRMSDVRKAYGRFEALHGISLDIEDGEFVILVGPSGCGKSTLLRMIAGLESITGGEIAIGGKVVNRLPPRQRDIAMVFQSYALYPHMTVSENMGFSLKLQSADKGQIRGRVDEAAGILGLAPLLDRKPAHLSGGQRQRVAMGRSIVRDPKVFLFDEPLSNLDAKLRVQMRSEIKSLHNRLRTTIVYVTHDQVEAMTMADRIVVMNAGSIEQIGTPMELYDTPQSLFVAGFIGSPAMNFLSGEVHRGDAGPVLVTEAGSTIPVPPEAPPGRPLVLGIRPEDLVPSAEGGLEVETTLVEPTGSETLVTARLGADTLMVLVRERRQISVGDRLKLSVDPGRLHFFDRESERRVG